MVRRPPSLPEGSQDPWQSDALATFMAWEALDRSRPEADLVANAAGTVEAAMDREALAVARPASSDPAERGGWAARDLLAEVKGAAALRGVKRLVGEEKFRAGVRAWLEAKAQRGGGAEALLKALSTAAGRDVGPAVRSLVVAPGVPLVDARAVCDAAGARIDLAVTRYRLLGAAPVPGPAPWLVPVCARYEAAAPSARAAGSSGPEAGPSRCPPARAGSCPPPAGPPRTNGGWARPTCRACATLVSPT